MISLPSSVRSGASVSRCMTGGMPPSGSENIFGSTWISPSWRFQYVHIAWFGTTSPVGVFTSSVMGRSSRLQKCFAHGPGATTTCSTSIVPSLGLDGGDVPAARRHEAGDLDTRQDRDALGLALADEALHRVEVEREPALLLVQADGHVLRAPVGEELLHVRVDLGLAEDQLGLVADPLVPLVDRVRSDSWRSGRARCSRPGCTRRPRDPTPTPRRTPASARPSRAGSSCCARRRRRCRMHRRRGRSCRRRGCRCPSRGLACASSLARW